jgi:hypothetical protein
MGLDHAGQATRLAHFSSGEVESNKNEILEGARAEQRPVVLANTNRIGAQELEESIEHIERWLLGGSDQRVSQRDQQLPGRVDRGKNIGTPRSASRMRSSRRAGPGISSVVRGRSPKAQRPAISATKSSS